MEAAGFVPADYEGDEVEVWPENWPAYRLFSRVGTQWRHGMNGPKGLCYEAIYPLLDRMTGSPDEWDELLDDVRVMEQEALSIFAKP